MLTVPPTPLNPFCWYLPPLHIIIALNTHGPMLFVSSDPSSRFQYMPTCAGHFRVGPPGATACRGFLGLGRPQRCRRLGGWARVATNAALRHLGMQKVWRGLGWM